MFEITQIAVEETYEVELQSADNEPLVGPDGKPISITVYGPGSKAYAKAQAARNQRVVDRMAKRGRVKLSAEEQAQEDARFLAAVTVRWNGWGYQGRNDRDIWEVAYADRSIGFIGDQVMKAVGDWANFTKRPSSSSPSTSGTQPG
jgi:hypothetical protein